MKILLLGSGGRECAIARKISESSRTTALYIAPGNGGTDAYGTNVAIKPTDFQAIADFVMANGIDMLVAGNEDPLVEGVRDYMRDHCPTLLVVGPEKAGAMLEGSKDFAKQFMMRHGVPTARYRSFTADTIEDAYRFMEEL